MDSARIGFFVLYFVTEASSFAYVYFMDTAHFREWAATLFSHKTHTITAGIYSFLLVGRAMILFRLLPGVRSKAVKHVHALLHTLCLLGTYVDLHATYYTQQVYTWTDGERFHQEDNHYLMFRIVGVLYHIEWLSGMLVFYTTSQRIRRVFATVHNFLGIVVFYILIVMCTIMTYTTDNRKNYDDPKAPEYMYANAAAVLYGLVTIGILICPLFEWPLVSRTGDSHNIHMSPYCTSIRLGWTIIISKEWLPSCEAVFLPVR